MTQPSIRSLGLFAVLTLALAACGGDDGGGGVASLDETATTAAPASAEQTQTAEEAALAFTQCLRDEGLDVPDPTFDENGGFRLDLRSIFGGGPGDGTGPSDDVRSAMDACGDLMQGLRQGFGEEDVTALQDNLVAFAQCMRDNGVDMADPDLSTAGNAGGPGGGRGLVGDLDLSDPDVIAAMETCQTVFGGGFGPGSGLPGGGFGGPPPADGGGPSNGGTGN